MVSGDGSRLFQLRRDDRLGTMSMSEQTSGYLYILTNDAMPGLVKVGKTYVGTEGRAKQLSGATGVPFSFKVFKEYAVTQCDAAERRAHMVLEKVVGRPNERREFFIGTPENIAEILDDVLAAFRSSSSGLPSEIIQCMLKVERGEFTVAHAEFNLLLKSMTFSPTDLLMNQDIKRMFGAYLAACCFVGQRPLHQHHILRMKTDCMREAIAYLETSNPATAASNVIAFVRLLES